ncbi:MAG TPA: hypothetical protein VLU47_08885 [Blastocatellia bacterium]|nr:hypothetical protein [Blastocatellia bacterium]
MKTTTNKSLFSTDSSSLLRCAARAARLGAGGLYHQVAVSLLKGIHHSESLSRTVTQLVLLAERAYALRQFEMVGAVSKALFELPLPRQHENIGLFYEALSINRGGTAVGNHARPIFERVWEEGNSLYRAKGMLALGTMAKDGTAPSYYKEVIRILSSESIFDPLTAVRTSRWTAVARAEEGDHEGALADLEKLGPLVRAAAAIEPSDYYDHLNSLAVELGEVGRIEEALRLSQVVVASPFAAVYPCWHETLDEIKSKTQRSSLSIVAVSQAPSGGTDSPGQIISWPGDSDRQGNSISPSAKDSARIINLGDWKKKLDKKSNGNTQKEPSVERIRSMTLEEKQATITRYVYGDQVTDEMLNSILQVTLAPGKAERDEV